MYDGRVATLEHLDDERLTVMGLFAETFTGLGARVAAQLAEHGLSVVEFEVLVRLARSPEGMLRMTDLSAQTSLTTSGVTRVVDRLAERGLVARQACATDRRTTYAVVTEPGRTLLAGVLPDHLQLIEAWLAGPLRDLAAAEGVSLASFVAVLRGLRDHVVPCATAGSAGPVDRPAAPAAS
jgi:DNA-binding MarR family transcriptional regulator